MTDRQRLAEIRSGLTDADPSFLANCRLDVPWLLDRLAEVTAERDASRAVARAGEEAWAALARVTALCDTRPHGGAHLMCLHIAEVDRLRAGVEVERENALIFRTRRDELHAERDRALADLIAVRAERDRLAAKVRAIQTVHCWTNEDGKQFLFADDIRAALTDPTDTARAELHRLLAEETSTTPTPAEEQR